jgi:hypothetical protein
LIDGGRCLTTIHVIPEWTAFVAIFSLFLLHHSYPARSVEDMRVTAGAVRYQSPIAVKLNRLTEYLPLIILPSTAHCTRAMANQPNNLGDRLGGY